MSYTTTSSFFEPLNPGNVSRSMAEHWLKMHLNDVRMFMYDRDPHSTLMDFGRMLNGNVGLGYEVVYDYTVPNDTKKEWLREWLTGGSNIINLIGKRGGGKTATAFKILEMLHDSGRQICVLGPPQKLPPEFKRVGSLQKIPSGAGCFVDEIGVQFNSRSSVGSKERVVDLSILPTLRHTDRTIVAATQLAALGDVNFTRLSDMFVVKPMGLFGTSLDRDSIMSHVPDAFMPATRETSHVFCNQFRCNVDLGLSRFWKEEYSTPYTVLQPDEVVDYLTELLGDGLQLDKILSELWMRSSGLKKDEVQHLIKQIEN